MGKAKLSDNGNRVSVVEQAIASVGGSPSELAVKLSKICGEEITRQRVHGWRLRGTFPRELMPAVERLCGIPIEELAVAKVRERNPENPVEKSIRKATPEGTPAALAEALSKISGQRFTRQMVNNWQAAEQFPTDVVPWVHLLTKIPVKELLWGRREQRFPDLDSVKGIWSKAEAEEFDAAIAPLGKIDPALWAAEPQAPYRARTPRRTRRPRR